MLSNTFKLVGWLTKKGGCWRPRVTAMQAGLLVEFLRPPPAPRRRYCITEKPVFT